MPVVPIAEKRVGIAAVCGEKFQAPDLRGSGLEAVGHYLQDLGAHGSELAAAPHNLLKHQATGDAKEAGNRLVAAGDAYLDDPTTGILAKHGKDAVDAYEPTLR